MYKPHTIEQYKVYRFLEENFALEHFLLAPLSRFGLILEDKTGEKIAVKNIGHTKRLLVGKRVGIVQPPAGQRFKVMDDWAGRKAAELF